MKQHKRGFAVLLAALLMLSALSGCGETAAPADTTPVPVPSAAPQPLESVGATVVYASTAFEGNFSPFFADSAADRTVVALTQSTLRELAEVEEVKHDDGSVDYHVTLREDAVFSDGTAVDIDDVIFSLYVLADPTYDGLYSIHTLPIEGMVAYQKDLAPLDELLIAAGRGNTDFRSWDETLQKAFWKAVDQAGEKLAQSKVDDVMATACTDENVQKYIDPEKTARHVQNNRALKVQLAMALCGYEDAWFEGATVEDFWYAIEASYPDLWALSEAEYAQGSFFDHVEGYASKYAVEDVVALQPIKSITGLVRTGGHSLTIHMSAYDAAALEQLDICVAPLHYYGDESLYDHENGSYGFTKGKLSTIRENSAQPLGCGAYVFQGFGGGVLTLEANENSPQEAPAVKYLLLQEAEEGSFASGVNSGLLDVATAPVSRATAEILAEVNGGQLSGSVIETELFDHQGYGYIGVNAQLVNVGGEPWTTASRNLRKAFLTLFAACRESAVGDYYGSYATVIDYPISATSWAAPTNEDEGYRSCYSVDVEGKSLYKPSMTESQKLSEAYNAAVAYLQAAGYTYDERERVFTAAPEGASLRYEILIPGGEEGDHPAYAIAAAASERLMDLGITLVVTSVETAAWREALESNSCAMWAGAWATPEDPDLYQRYHSQNAYGRGTNGNHYQINDPQLDELIAAGRASGDKDTRRALYLQAMEIVLDWACELPLYQRKEATMVSVVRVDAAALPCVELAVDDIAAVELPQ